MRPQVDTAIIVLQPITTFDESIEAAQIVTRAIEDGVLDDAGETAEITPLSFEVAHDGVIVGVVVKILASAKLSEGMFASGRFKRHDSSVSDTQPAALPRRVRRGAEMLETTAVIPKQLISA